MGKKGKLMIDELKSKGIKVIIPNAFTAFRLGTSFKIIKEAVNGDLKNAAIWATLGGISDAFDGGCARALDAGSEFGAKFDQVVDKIYSISLIAPLLEKEPKWAIIVLGELAIAKTNLEKELKGTTVKSSIEGKLKTIMLFSTIALTYVSESLNLNDPKVKSFLNGMFGASVIMEMITLASYKKPKTLKKENTNYITIKNTSN